MLLCCEIHNGYRAACHRWKHTMSHHAWLPSLQDQPCTIKTIADLRWIPVELSMLPAWWKTKLRHRSHSMCAQLSMIYDLNQAITWPTHQKFVPAMPIAVHDPLYQMLLLNLANREPISVHCLWPLTNHHILWCVPSQCYGAFCKPTDVLAWHCWHREIPAAENELLFLGVSIDMTN